MELFRGQSSCQELSGPTLPPTHIPLEGGIGDLEAAVTSTQLPKELRTDPPKIATWRVDGAGWAFLHPTKEMGVGERATADSPIGEVAEDFQAT